MNRRFNIKTYFIILLVILILVVGSLPGARVWAGSPYQTVPPEEPIPDDEEPEFPPGDGKTSDFWEFIQENLGILLGCLGVLLLGGAIGGGIIARWWVRRRGDIGDSTGYGED